MKIICLCQKGNSRSVVLSWLLKSQYHHEALAAGMVTTHRRTRKMLYDWADLIILMTPRYRHWIPTEYDSKVLVCDVGTDIWFKGHPQDLVEKCQKFIGSQEVFTPKRGI